jgi:hypothetical protein
MSCGTREMRLLREKIADVKNGYSVFFGAMTDYIGTKLPTIRLWTLN